MVRAERLIQTRNLDRVTQFGSCTMCFDVADATGSDIRFLQRRQNQVALRLRIWDRISGGPSTVVDDSAFDDAVDVIAVVFCLLQGLEKERTYALTRHISIRALPEAAADTVDRQCVANPIDIQFGLMQVEVHAADDGCGTLACMDRFTSQINGRQARGTRRVYRQARAGEIHPIRNAIGNAPEKRVGSGRVAGVLFLDANDLIHRPYCTNEHAYISRRVLLCQDLGIVARVFNCFPCHFEKQPLLRIQHFCLSGGNVEEQRVELIHVVDESAAVGLDVPMLQPPFTTGRWNVVDTIAPSNEVVPQFTEILRLGIPAGHSDDCDVFGPARVCVRDRRSRFGVRGPCDASRRVVLCNQFVGPVDVPQQLGRAALPDHFRNVGFGVECAKEPIDSGIDAILLEPDRDGQSNDVVETRVLLHPHAMRGGAYPGVEIQPGVERSNRIREGPEFRNLLDVDQNAVATGGPRNRDVVVLQRLPHPANALDPAQHARFDLPAILQRKRHHLPVDQIDPGPLLLNDVLEPVKQRDVVAGDDPAFRHAKVLGQAGDNGICAREDVAHNRPNARACVFLFLLDEEPRVFDHARAVDHERNRMLGEQGLHIPEMTQRHGRPARRIVVDLDAHTRNPGRIFGHLRLQRRPVDVAFVRFR